MSRMAVARVVLVSAVAMLVGPFQLYQNSVIPNLYRPIRQWVVSIHELPIQNDTNVTTADAIDAETIAAKLGLISSMNFIGPLFGIVALILLTDVPRTSSLIFIAALTTANAALPFLAVHWQSLTALLLHRLFCGALFSGGASIAALLIGELAPTSYRGALLSGQVVATLLAGVLASVLTTPYLLGTIDGWPYALAIGPAVAIAAVVILPFVPESPRYLFLVRRDEAGSRRSIQFYQGADKVDDVIAELRSEATLDANEAHSLLSLLQQPGTIRALFTIIALAATLGLQGSLVIMINLTFLLHSLSATFDTASVLTTVIIISSAVPVLSGPYIVERFGRRPPIVVSSLLFAACYATLFVLHQLQPVTSVFVVGVLALLTGYWCFCYHYSTLLALYTEAFPQNSRLLGLCCARVSGTLASFAGVATFLPLCERLGVDSALVLYAVGSVLAAIVGYVLAPETKGKTFEQIYRQYFLPSGRGRLDSDTPEMEEPLVPPSQPTTTAKQHHYGAVAAP